MLRTSLLSALLLSSVLFAQGPPRGPQPRPVLLALDTDHDGELSAGEISAASASLLTLDVNGDGQLTQDEYLPRVPGLGASADEQVKQMMLFDKNGDGVLTVDELPERMRGLFQRGDTNHDGKLTANEIRALTGRQGVPMGRRPQAGSANGMLRTDALINALDANHDGVIDAAEIANAPNALRALDTNNDGKLTADEIKVRQQTARERVEHLLDEWDANKDGKMTKDEMPDRMAPRFDEIDTNHDGVLTMDELIVFYSNPDNMQQQRPSAPEKK